jgi:hypothetical protein
MTRIAFSPTYSEAQSHVFFDSEPLGRFRIVPKGRRLGITRGAAHACIEWMLEGKAVLWGDTVNSNIRRYVERYFLPALKADGIPYEWNIIEKLIRIGGGYTDFRSADNPETWEGFGYDVIFLNEAGIILQGQNGLYLYQNAVLPMMLDNPASQLIAAGAPKGKQNLFYELYQRALSGESGYYQRTFSSYDNPWLSREAIAQLEGDMFTLGGQALVDQEIYGKFVEAGDDELRVIPRAWIDAAIARWRERPQPDGHPEALGVDVARGGRDKTAIAPRWGTYFGEVETWPGSSTPDGPTVAALVLKRVGPETDVNIDVVAVGTSPYDHTLSYHPRTHPINGGAGSQGKERTGQLAFVNLRAEMYWSLREALDPATGSDVALPDDEELAQDLSAATWKLTARGILVEPKDDIIKRLGRSPDKGDAVVQSHYVVPVKKRRLTWR